jgi:hypothetical protein
MDNNFVDYQEGYKDFLNQTILKRENGYFFNLHNHLFYKKNDIVKRKDIIKNIISDINSEIEKDPCISVPPYQTQPDLHKRYKESSHWNYLIKSIGNSIDRYVREDVRCQNITGLKCEACWANVSKPESNYSIHNHQTDLSVVYFIKNPSKIYGTLFKFDESEIILCSEENSLVIFDPKLQHCIVSPPPQVSSLNPRYSIVFDYSFSYE